MRGKLPAAALITIALLTSSATAQDKPAAPPANTFTNPITRRDAPDPWVIRHGNHYYLTATLEPNGGIWVWRSKSLTNIDAGEKIKVWTAPPTGPMSKMIWAPELHRLDDKWYLYFTASDGVDKNHRHYVLTAKTDDPLGPYSDPAPVDPALDSYAIDGSVLQTKDGKRYWLYTTGKLEIAAMTSPTKVDGSRRTVILEATEPWERNWVEAPQALHHAGRTFLVYSAGHSGTPHYALGLLELTGPDPLDPKSWKKHQGPVFYPYFGPDGAVYNVGHNSFTTSPDGTEHWIVYHGKDWRDDRQPGFHGRTARAQKFTWTPTGLPNFAHPIPSGIPLPTPSGE